MYNTLEMLLKHIGYFTKFNVEDEAIIRTTTALTSDMMEPHFGESKKAIDIVAKHAFDMMIGWSTCSWPLVFVLLLTSSRSNHRHAQG
jgi:hypothetical protein